MKTMHMCAAAFALISVTGIQAIADDGNQTSTTIQLTAQVSSFDNISCSQSTLDLNGGSAITQSGTTVAQPVNCSVTTNDTADQSVTVYVSSSLIGSGDASNTIPDTAIEWGTSSSGSFTPFTSQTGGVADGKYGAVVAGDVPVGDNQPVNFYLTLDVPAGQHADTYNGTLTVAITPAVE